MRKAISFTSALAMLFVCAYALYFLLFEAAGFRIWMLVAAAVGLFFGANWLWEDFIAPRLGRTTRRFGWFKNRQPDGSKDDAPEGEAEKVVQVQLICQLVNGSAESLREAGEDKEWLAYERERYEKQRARALELARTITDDFYRDAAIHKVINLCMTAGDRKEAKALFWTVRTDVIRDAILEGHPALK